MATAGSWSRPKAVVAEPGSAAESHDMAQRSTKQEGPRDPAVGGAFPDSATIPADDTTTQSRLAPADAESPEWPEPPSERVVPEPTGDAFDDGVSEASLRAELARDLEHLSAASSSLAATQAWVEQCPDETSALAALTDAASGAEDRSFSVQRDSSYATAALGVAFTHGCDGGESASRDDSPVCEDADGRQGVESSGRASVRGGGADPRIRSEEGMRTSSCGGHDKPGKNGDDAGPSGRNAAPDLGDSVHEVEYVAAVPADAQTEQRGSEPRRGAIVPAESDEDHRRDAGATDTGGEPDGVRGEPGRVSETKVIRVVAGDSIEARSQRLDQRASALRDRVARAQEALELRAKRLRSSLAKEKDRLRAFHTKLREKARELAEIARAEKLHREEEYAAGRAKLKAARADLERREAELHAARAAMKDHAAEWEDRQRDLAAREKDVAGHLSKIRQRKAELEEAGRKELARRKAELEEKVRARLLELDGDSAARYEDLDFRADAMSRGEAGLSALEGELNAREARLIAREEALEKERQDWQAGREEKGRSSAEQVRREREEAAREAAAQQAESEDAAGRREADLADLRKLIDEREAAVAQREESVQALKESVERREESSGQRDTESARRDEELARLSAAMEVREKRLAQWQARVEDAETGIETERLRLEQERSAMERSAEENQGVAAELDARVLEIKKDREDLDRKLAEVEPRLKELRRQAAAITAREEETRQRQTELDAVDNGLIEERERLARLDAHEAELDRRESETASREAELVRRETSLDERVTSSKEELAALERSRDDMESLRSRLEAHRQMLESRRQEADEQGRQAEQRKKEADDRMREAEASAQRLDQTKLEQEREQARIEESEAAHSFKVASLEKDRLDLAADREVLDEAQVSLQLDRQRFEEQEQQLAEQEKGLQREADRLAAEEAGVGQARAGISREADELAREKETWAERKSALDDDIAKAERDAIAQRDRERMLDDRQSRLEAREGEAERTREALSERLEEAEAQRRQVNAEAERQRVHEERLAEETTAVEVQREALKVEAAETAEQREVIEESQRRLTDDREHFDVEQVRLREESEALEQSQRTFQAGLRSLEEDRRELEGRQSKLADRAHQLESFRDRLDQEYAELQRQREEMLATHEAHGDSANEVAVMMRQAEEQQQELRHREDVLDAHGQALAARAAELSKAEDDVGRRQGELDERTSELDRQRAVLDEHGKKLEAEVDAGRAEIEAVRREGESTIAKEREDLARERREHEAALVARQVTTEADDAAIQKRLAEEARARAEEDLSDRRAEMERREAEVQGRCDARLEEVEKDIEQRLADLETEIRDQREQAGREIEDRRCAMEDEMAIARGRLDEQIEDLRRRQGAIAEEQALLGERRRDIETELREFHEQTAAVLVAEDADEESIAAGEREDSGSEAPVRDRAGDDPAHSEAAGETPVPQFCGEADDEVARVVGESAPEVARRFRPIRVIAAALFLGLLAALGYLYSPSGETCVRGRLVLNDTDSATPLTAEEHRAGLWQPVVLKAASEVAGADLRQLLDAETIKITMSPTGDAVELSAFVPWAERDSAQRWIGALAAAYEDSLGRTLVTEESRKARLSGLQSELEALQVRRRTAVEEHERLTKALATDPRLQELDSARREKEQLAPRVAGALDSLNKAKEALAAFEKAPVPATPVVPSDEQLRMAYASDAVLVQALEQRDAKARGFHRVLITAMSEAQTPMTLLQTSIEAFSDEVRRQLAEQTDTDIRSELERIVVDLEDCVAQFNEFSRGWDDLVSKAACWKAGGPADLLIEYQQKAEMLVRAFHGESVATLGAASKKADAIGRAGSEMTKRRIIQNALMKLAHTCHEIRVGWIMAARGVVPADNRELKALRNAVRDLAPRIEQKQEAHRQKLIEHLGKARADAWAVRHQRLLDEKERATRHHEELSDAFVRMDSRISRGDKELEAELQTRRAEIETKEAEIARTDLDEAGLKGRIELVQAQREVNMGGTVRYESASLPPIPPDWFDLDKLSGAIVWGVCATAAFVLFAWMVSRPRWLKRESAA